MQCISLALKRKLGYERSQFVIQFNFQFVMVFGSYHTGRQTLQKTEVNRMTKNGDEECFEAEIATNMN